METENAGQAKASVHAEPCICGAIASHIIDALGIRSETAREHIRNARIEMLKAVRSVIDERIDQLSRVQEKGTKIAVE